MTLETQDLISKYLNTLSLNKWNNDLLTPVDLQHELKQVSVQFSLPLEPTLDNIYITKLSQLMHS